MQKNSQRISSIFHLIAFFLLLAGSDILSYDPLEIPDNFTPKIIDCSVSDKTREREIPIRIYLPYTENPAPVVLFSHGLGGTREGSAFLGKHWAARGYISIFLQHPGSDSSIWKNQKKENIMEALRKAADGAEGTKNFLLRVKDIPIVIDQIEQWNNSENHPLFKKVEISKIGMSGHSFGAITAQAVSGQTLISDKISFKEPRIKAAIIFSPSSPRVGKPEDAFGSVHIPWMLMTGTRDIAIIGNIDMKSRLAVFPALPNGSKYELILFNAEHSVFTERPLPGETGKRNPNHHRAIKALSTAFWDAYLKDNQDAKKWLDGNGPATILEKEDSFRKK